jgi:hypothetical protein
MYEEGIGSLVETSIPWFWFLLKMIIYTNRLHKYLKPKERKETNCRVSTDIFNREGRRQIYCYEGPQAIPARPSDKGSFSEGKTLEIVLVIFKNPVRTVKKTPHFTVTKINRLTAV